MYNFIWWLCKLIVHSFYALIQVNNANYVPQSGPIIFYGNHQNQFVDAMLLFSQTRRAVSFLMAQSSFSKYNGVLGAIARAMRAIPVRRRIDEAIPGRGKVRILSSPPVDVTNTHGCSFMQGDAATDFTEQLSEGTQVDMGVHGVHDPPTVIQVLSPHTALLSCTHELPFDVERNFKVLPKINQSDVFDSVVKCLTDGDCVGIFPEGGSHDRSDLLPLKSGIAVMALKAAESGAAPILVPVGLNYFGGHRFRSRVIIDFGVPIVISEELMDLYKRDKRAATSELMELVEMALRNVTLNLPSFEELELLTLLRRLYQPTHLQLHPNDYMRLNHRFIQGYRQFKDDPLLLDLKEDLSQYSNSLKAYGLTDVQVADPTPFDFKHASFILFLRSVFSFVILILALPCLLINAPIGLFVRWYSNKQAKIALSKSSVKLTGRDVIASNKIILSVLLVPLIYVIYSILVGLFFGWIVGLGFLVILPFATAISIKFLENAYLIWKASVPVLFSLIKSDYRSNYLELKQQRTRLQTIVRDSIEKIGPRMGDQFWQDRIVKPEHLTSKAFPTSPSGSVLHKSLALPASRSWDGVKEQPLDVEDPFVASVLFDDVSTSIL